MSTVYRTTTRTTTIDEAERDAREQAAAFFGDLGFRYVSSHALQESVDTSTYGGGTSTAPTVVSVDWVFEESA